MAFIAAAVESSKADGTWVAVGRQASPPDDGRARAPGCCLRVGLTLGVLGRILLAERRGNDRQIAVVVGMELAQTHALALTLSLGLFIPP